MVAVLVPISIPQGLDAWVYWVLLGLYSIMLLVAILALIISYEEKRERDNRDD